MSLTSSIPADRFRVDALEPRRLLSANVASLDLDLGLGNIPELHSDSAAPVAIYLDFNGDATANWGPYHPGTTPAYDQDGDPATFNAGEIGSIRAIWRRVAELYSPFNIDVTTADPGKLLNQQALRIVIGGNGAWSGSADGGLSFVGSFASKMPNTVYVFSGNLGGGDPTYAALAAAHEAGHAFGLKHQSVWSGRQLVNEYNPGDDHTAPLMGYPYDADRAIWWNGPTPSSPTRLQDDMAIVGGSDNGFGYRPDDHGNKMVTADALSVTGMAVRDSGIIQRATDADWFKFVSGEGPVKLGVASIGSGAMLEPKLSLYAGDGSLLGWSEPGNSAGPIRATLPAGTYYLKVSGHGSYGDVGQYTVTGSIVPPGASIPATGVPLSPYKLVASRAGDDVLLSWRDRSNNESEFQIEKSLDGALWNRVQTVPANSTGATIVNGVAEDAWYRVRAANKLGASSPSNVAHLPPPILSTAAIPASASPSASLFSATPVPPSPGGEDILLAARQSKAGGELWTPQLGERPGKLW